MVGTWTSPGAIFTVAFNDAKLTLDMIKRTAIPENEPISWMTFSVSFPPGSKGEAGWRWADGAAIA